VFVPLLYPVFPSNPTRYRLAFRGRNLMMYPTNSILKPSPLYNTLHVTHPRLRISSTHRIDTIYLLTQGAEPFFRSHQLCSHSRTSQHFMEPSTGPYPEPHQSNPHHPILSKNRHDIMKQNTARMLMSYYKAYIYVTC
jgi:hypothetical protein